jgi:hypothetical protein
MKRYIFAFFVGAVILFSSCADHDVKENSCMVSDPVSELPWLATQVEEMAQSNFSEYAYVVQARHKAETIFIFANCCPICSSVYQVYNCNGEIIGSIGDKQFTMEMLQSGTVIWKGHNSSCVFR